MLLCQRRRELSRTCATHVHTRLSHDVLKERKGVLSDALVTGGLTNTTTAHLMMARFFKWPETQRSHVSSSSSPSPSLSSSSSFSCSSEADVNDTTEDRKRKRRRRTGENKYTIILQLKSLVLLLLLLVMHESPNHLATFLVKGDTFSSHSAHSRIFIERRVSSNIVNTQYGSLQGQVYSFPGLPLEPVQVFLGIPYAASPTAKLRFMPPVTPDFWNGVRSADKHGPSCPQNLTPLPAELHRLRTQNNRMSDSEVKAMLSNETLLQQLLPPQAARSVVALTKLLSNQSEDCLYLNIYTPGLRKGSPAKLPVLVFIPGGGPFFSSAAAFDGSVLASFGKIIVVTINIRLGILGFLPGVDNKYSSRGNFALMDIIAALHYVAENIEFFGGDASKVTIAGHGKGASSVHLLMLSPMVKGLFHRAILMSGSALSPWATSQNNVKSAREVAEYLSCPSDVKKYSQMVECLRKQTIDSLLAAEPIAPSHLAAFAPDVDGVILPSDPLNLMLSENSVYTNYDLLFGVSKVESYAFNAKEELTGIDMTKRNKVLRTLIRNCYSYRLQEIFLSVSNEYTDWTRGKPESAVSLMETTAEAVSDCTVVAPLVKSALIHARKSKKSSSFFYYFGHVTDSSETSDKLGSTHGSELPFIFGAPVLSSAPLSSPSSSSSSSSSYSMSPSMSSSLSGKVSSTFLLGYFDHDKYSSAEVALSQLVMTYWSNFVKFGDPNVGMNSNEARSLASGSPTHAMVSGANSSYNSNERTSHNRSPAVAKINWPHFDEQQQQFLAIGLEKGNRVKDHYRAHKLSLWLNLVAKLNQPYQVKGSLEEAIHLLPDHDDLTSYDGVVRQTVLFTGHSNKGDQANHGTTSSLGHTVNASLIVTGDDIKLPASDASRKRHFLSENKVFHGDNGKESHLDKDSDMNRQDGKQIDGDSSFLKRSTEVSTAGGGTSGGGINAIGSKNISATSSSSVYTTTLTITIVFGLSFLLLNILVLLRELSKKDGKRSRTNKRTISRLPSESSASCTQMQVQGDANVHECSVDVLLAKEEIDQLEHQHQHQLQHQLHQTDTHILQETGSGAGSLSFHPELIATHMAISGHHPLVHHHHNNTLLQVPAHVTLYPVMEQGNSSTV